MIELRKANLADRVLELGGGDNPHPESNVNVDIRPGPKVHFTHDFAQMPWPLRDDEWDVVFSSYLLEHLPYRLVPEILKEVYRVTKPGGQVVFALPNTESQMEWIKANPGGWDGKGPFESMSEVLFGSQNMPDPEGDDANTLPYGFIQQIMHT